MARQIVGYGLSEQLPRIFPSPIVANRSPLPQDINYPIGQIWINRATDAGYLLTDVSAGIATWPQIVSASAGVFATITSTGAATLATTGASASTIGNTTGGTSVTISAGTGGISLSAGGAVALAAATSSVASPTAAATVNQRVGAVTFTGFTTVAAAKQTFTITNSTVLATSAIFCTVSNVNNVNDAQMTLLAVRIASAGGSFQVFTQNNGAAALDGNVRITFWVIN